MDTSDAPDNESGLHRMGGTATTRPGPGETALHALVHRNRATQALDDGDLQRVLERAHPPAAESQEPAPAPALSEDRGVIADMARCVLSLDPGAAGRLLAGLRARGLSVETLYLDLFEATAQRLGRWCEEARCSDADVAIGMSRLQSLVRRLGADFSHERNTLAFERSTLVATQPGESCGLRLALDTEFFWRAGWQVDVAFPARDEDLGQRLARQWFDVLDLSLGSAHRSDWRLLAMAGTIRAARVASLNPALVVIVGGRVFGEHPGYGMLVGADAGCASPAGSLADAAALLGAVQRPYFSAAQRALQSAGLAVNARASRTPRDGGARVASH